MENLRVITFTEFELDNLISKSVDKGVESALSRLKLDGPQTNLVNKEEAAKLLSCSTSTIDKLAQSSKLTRHYIGAKAVRFDREQVLSIPKKTVFYKSKPR
jgi:excisionase family DNA binding protein